MSLPAVIDMDGFEKLEKVADLVFKGKSEYQIARTLHIKVVEARAYMKQFQEIVNNDADSRDAARDHLNMMIQRYERLIERTNKNLEDLEALPFDEKVSAQINASLKNIGDYDKTRVDLLQKAGLLENNELGDELAEREEREAVILEILRNDLCEVCRPLVRRRIKEKLEPQSSVVEGEVIE